jgi:GNAT superfamily N-acetyltransferase
MQEIILMERGKHEPHVRELFWEYLSWANGKGNEAYGISFDIHAMLEQGMAELDTFSPPQGRLLLARQGDEIAGCACLRKIGEGTAEIKRMYVRPEHRGKGLGRALLEALILEARQAGYARIRLDSVRFMREAQALYTAQGFQPIEPYAESEIPAEFHSHWVFMELDLKGR